MFINQVARREARRAGSKRKGQRVLENVCFKSDLFMTLVKTQLNIFVNDFVLKESTCKLNEQSTGAPSFEILTGSSWHSREGELPRLLFPIHFDCMQDFE